MKNVIFVKGCPALWTQVNTSRKGLHPGGATPHVSKGVSHSNILYRTYHENSFSRTEKCIASPGIDFMGAANIHC